MLYNRQIDKLLIVVVPIGLFAYASTRPRMRLRVDMPPSFVDVQRNMKPAQLNAEKQLAHAYWDCVLSEVQWKYSYGGQLPDIPPDQFRLTAAAPPGPEPPNLSRVRYWNRLRKIWLDPNSWQNSGQWNTEWFFQPVKKTIDGVVAYFGNILRNRT